MPEFRWEYQGEGILEEISPAPMLTRNPRDRQAGVRPLKTEPGGYTAPFDDALLVYQVLRDFPCIQLRMVRWDT